MKITVGEILQVTKGKLLYGSQEAIVSSVGFDSREIEPGALFVPTPGEKADGHSFIGSAFENGAVATFVRQGKEVGQFLDGKAYIQVEDTVAALQALGSWYRDRFHIPVIGITGSVGKTTTKEMIGAALSVRYRVLKTIGNRNSQLGLPLMMFCFGEETQVAVIEMGMSEEGEMGRLSAIAKPDMVVLTNIGVAHIQQLGSKENIRKEKLSSLDCFGGSRKRRKLFLNGDDALLREVAEGLGSQSLLASGQETGHPAGLEGVLLHERTRAALMEADCAVFGLESGADFNGKDVQVRKDGKTCFTFVYPEGEEEITLSVLGLHNVENALVALAVAYELGIAPAEAKEGLLKYEPMDMRGKVHQRDGVTIVDDTYNASPDSMKSSVNILLQMEGLDRRVAVLGDIFELGEVSRSCHYEVGQFISGASYEGRRIDEVVTVGQAARAIGDGAREAGGSREGEEPLLVQSFGSNEEALAYLEKSLKSGDGIVVKGSRGMEMEAIVNGLLGQSGKS